ncbi:hypothetical protein [Hymenobacter latericus]|uniref:hypothetical protein n=1 Tax=Hymenobacter sp. YIM 151858-1 TaxID=2987688 RepID=UPI002227031D|nr:hypothetical protein [Hymenobacter sp. YIM 151858-1]UYZ57447.1 hypothetical protein OIS50_10230 [Hymenobacter sp. YIM 151858-1]
MDVLIKSCNRPYYLERCIKSVYKYVSGVSKIKVMDDGTPPEYLRKIASLFPEVEIVYSPNYQEKVEALQLHLAGQETYKKFQIPAGFWYKTVEDSSDIFLLIEDDIWITQPVDLAEVNTIMNEQHMVMLRLAWQGNATLVAGRKVGISDNIEEITPEISSWDEFVFMNKYKFRSVFYRLGFFQSIMKYQLPFYVLYAVASACFDKKYWLYLWKDARNIVLEEDQLKKASTWYDQTHSRYGKLVKESTQTSYITSTTNGFREIDFDMVRFNYIMNQAWIAGELDAMHDFPKDFAPEYFRQFIGTSQSADDFFAQWLKWIERFKHQYRAVGCEVE